MPVSKEQKLDEIPFRILSRKKGIRIWLQAIEKQQVNGISFRRTENKRGSVSNSFARQTRNRNVCYEPFAKKSKPNTPEQKTVIFRFISFSETKKKESKNFCYKSLRNKKGTKFCLYETKKKQAKFRFELFPETRKELEFSYKSLRNKKCAIRIISINNSTNVVFSCLKDKHLLVYCLFTLHV